MIERPILFSTSMVKKILSDEKTQTRRILLVPWKGNKKTLPYEPYFIEEDGIMYFQDEYGDYHKVKDAYKCPYGRCGDLLWVKETWRIWESATFGSISGEPLDPDIIKGSLKNFEEEFLKSRPIEYLADTNEEGPWRSSIFMPKWASRIKLRITDVDVQKINDITDNDVCAEGFDSRDEFIKLWNNINEKSGYTFEKNNWVWVIKFKRILNNI